MTTIFEKQLDRGTVHSWMRSRPASFQIERGFRNFHKEKLPQLAVFSHDLIGSHINWAGIYEKPELDLFSSWIQQSDFRNRNNVCLDIGANIGNHSVFFSNLFKRVLAFEPNPKAFELLKINAKLAINIECIPVALSDKSEELTIHFQNGNIGGASLRSETGFNQTKIQAAPLDDMDLTDNIDLIKIDVEGHEHQVLLGAKKTILQCQPIILFEQQSTDFTGGSTHVIELLRSWGYEEFMITDFNFHISRNWLRNWIWRRVLAPWTGYKGRLKRINRFEPGFYPFIIAIPPRRPRNE